MVNEQRQVGMMLLPFGVFLAFILASLVSRQFLPRRGRTILRLVLIGAGAVHFGLGLEMKTGIATILDVIWTTSSGILTLNFVAGKKLYYSSPYLFPTPWFFIKMMGLLMIFLGFMRIYNSLIISPGDNEQAYRFFLLVWACAAVPPSLGLVRELFVRNGSSQPNSPLW